MIMNVIHASQKVHIDYDAMFISCIILRLELCLKHFTDLFILNNTIIFLFN